MKRISGPGQKRTFLSNCCQQIFIAAGLCLFLVLPLSLLSAALSSPAYAAVTAANGFSTSPAQGPVGTVITVTGSNISNGMQIQLGYTPDFRSCLVVSDSQVSAIANRTFTGSFRWPVNTGTGNFGVCIVEGGRQSFVIGSFQVLSTSPPQVSISPATPDAGRQAVVTGTNFLPAGTNVNLIWQSTDGSQRLVLGSISSDSNGAFSQTLTVPSHSSSGSYTLTASSSGGQPPALSASTTFHVNGITIAPVATPAKSASPTPVPAEAPTATSVSGAVQTTQPASEASTGKGTDLATGSDSRLLLPIALVGLLLIVLALLAGVLVVRRQRSRFATIRSNGANLGWSSSLKRDSATLPAARPVYSMDRRPLVIKNQNMEALPVQSRPVSTPVVPDSTSIPFDPTLAEAMREAQVSLFVIPRPLASEALPLEISQKQR
jgi:hypothetical protein